MEILGIDISKSSFDVYGTELGHQKFSNCPKGFKAFLKFYGSEKHVVMEATGYYHYRLAVFLKTNHLAVTVENPLIIKRFIQMKLTKVKTDKADAKLIYEYGISRPLPLWEVPSDVQQESSQILSLLSLYEKQSTALKNKLLGEQSMGTPSKLVAKSLSQEILHKKKQIQKLEQSLEEIVKKEYQKEVDLLRSIPGIGTKTSILLATLTDGMKDFQTSSQLCSYAGLTPVIRESGKSIRTRPRISKMGNGRLRALLFMCSFNACKSNKACKELYQRIITKGKSAKLALIAVCNKLLKQAFGILKSGNKYDENYTSILS